MSRTEITTHVWDENHEPGANLLDVYVSRLRRKVDAPGERPLLHTRRGMGVMLAASDIAPTPTTAGPAVPPPTPATHGSE